MATTVASGVCISAAARSPSLLGEALLNALEQVSVDPKRHGRVSVPHPVR